MFGFLKNLLRREPETRVESPQPPPPAATPVPRRGPAVSLPSRGYAPQQSRSGLELPLAKILKGLPLELQPRVCRPVADNRTMAIPLEKILAQLSHGVVKIPFGELRQTFPDVFSPEEDRDRVLVSLPLDDILARLNPSLITRRRVQRVVEVPDEITSPFEQGGALFGGADDAAAAAAAAPLPAEALPPSPAPVPPAVSARHSLASAPTPPPPAAAPLPPTVLPPVSFGRPLPVSPPAAPVPPEPTAAPETPLPPAAPIPFASTSPAAPTLAPVPPSRSAGPGPASPITPLAGLPAEPSVPPLRIAPAGRNGNGHSSRLPGSNGAGTSAHAPTPEPAPAPAKGPEATDPLNVGLVALAEGWPEAVRREIVALNLVDAQVALPAKAIEEGLRQGRIVFSWKLLRSHIRPAVLPSVSVHDSLVLELPLKVVAPLFLARQRNQAKPQAKVTIDEDIPNLFFGFPQPDAAAAAESTRGRPEDTNYYVWDDAADLVKVQESELKRGPSPGTKFVAKYATPNEIVSRAAALDGVAGALIALPDGLMVASKISPDLNAETLAAFLPQIFGKVSQCTRELRMGELNNLNFTVGHVPWKIFRVNAIFFAAFGQLGQALPTAQLAALAAELDHKPK